MIEYKLEQIILPITLAALGCDKSLSVETDGATTKFNVRLRHSIRFLVCRWNHEPGVSVGIPIVAGVPMDQIQEVAKTRLKERYEMLKMEWPGTDASAPAEPINGDN